MYVGTRIFFIYLCLLIGIFGSAEKNGSVFVPTREWQTVEKGVSIPSGLHVRHNFQTGVTEAKLMDENETTNQNTNDSNDFRSKSLTLHPDKKLPESEDDASSRIIKDPESLKYSIKELKARLKNLKQEKANDAVDDEDLQKELKKKFKSYEMLMKELKALEIDVKSDSELLSTFFQKFQTYKNAVVAGTLTPTEIEDVLDLLNNLEYLIHQIDNAHLFSDMGGLTNIISPCLNGTNNEIKAEALRLLGAAVQSNPKVQIKALETEFIQKLLHILSTTAKTEVKSRCLFALSALIRQFPVAQKTFINHGGLEIFGKILIDDTISVQIKVMNLISDLMIERQELERFSDPQPSSERIKEYALTDFEQKLLLHKYCQHLSNLMIKSFRQKLVEQFNTSHYDFLQYICENMITAAYVCKNVFKSNQDVLLDLMNDMLKLLHTNSDRTDDANSLELLIENLRMKILTVPHDEL